MTALCKVNICHALPDVHCVLIGYPPWIILFFVCLCGCVCGFVCVCARVHVYHSACRLQPRPEITFVTGKRVWNVQTLLFFPYYWQSSPTAPMNVIGVMTDLLVTAVSWGRSVLCSLLVLFFFFSELGADLWSEKGADSKLPQLLAPSFEFAVWLYLHVFSLCFFLTMYKKRQKNMQLILFPRRLIPRPPQLDRNSTAGFKGDDDVSG